MEIGKMPPLTKCFPLKLLQTPFKRKTIFAFHLFPPRFLLFLPIFLPSRLFNGRTLLCADLQRIRLYPCGLPADLWWICRVYFLRRLKRTCCGLRKSPLQTQKSAADLPQIRHKYAAEWWTFWSWINRKSPPVRLKKSTPKIAPLNCSWTLLQCSILCLKISFEKSLKIGF